MKLYFDQTKIREIVNAVESGKGHVRPYTGEPWGVPEDNTPGLILVGDRGIYLIGNDERKESPLEAGLIAYAKGFDPKKNRSAQDMKDSVWGPDDGVEFLSLADAKRLLLAGTRPYVEVSPTTLVWGS